MKTSIKVQLVEHRQRSLIGARQFHPRVRKHLHPYTFHSRPMMLVPTNQLNTKEKIIEYIWKNGGPGIWDMRAPCPCKHSKSGMTTRALVKVELQADQHDEYKYLLIQWTPMRLKRYRKTLGWGDKDVY